MKKVRTLIIAGTFLFTGFAVTSCGGEQTAEVEQIAQEEVWYCPMECEVDENDEIITHAEAGQCSVCEMDLVLMGS